jgi:hypothetical protein
MATLRTVPVASLALRLVSAIALVAWLMPLGALAPPASAHGKSVSYSAWHLDSDGAQISVRIPLLDLSRLGIPLPLDGSANTSSATRGVGLYLAERLELLTPAGSCTRLADPSSRPAETGWVRFRWSVECPPASPMTLRSRILLEQSPSHLHFARITLKPEDPTQRARVVERVLTAAETDWPLSTSALDVPTSTPSAELQGTSFTSYLRLGIEHILSGWDHLAFVLALILLARSLGEVARLVTGFTVAHSVTLALAVLGWIRVESGPVEALIGFSVALIAIENSWTLAGRGRWVPILTVTGLLALAGGAALAGIPFLPALTVLGLAIFCASHFELLRRAPDANLHRVALAFAFGLVHGFGFAGVLAEMTLPTERLATALLGFNVGVEIGQLAVVAVAWPLLAGLRKIAQGRPYRIFAELGSAAICGIGLYWFLVRSLAPG